VSELTEPQLRALKAAFRAEHLPFSSDALERAPIGTWERVEQ
jgi:hypothetical protein